MIDDVRRRGGRVEQMNSVGQESWLGGFFGLRARIIQNNDGLPHIAPDFHDRKRAVSIRPRAMRAW